MRIEESPKIVKVVLAVIGILLLLKISCAVVRPSGKSGLQVLKTVSATRGDLIVKISATGTVKPQNRVEIKPPIPGRVEDVLVREGDKVKMGQVLALMSSTERAALIDAARPQGEAVLKRWEEAYKPAPLLAPLDGMVIVRAVEPGQTVTTADPVVVLSDRLIVEALVDETDLSMVRLDQDVEIRLDAYPDKNIPAKVVHISYESTLVNNVNVYTIDIYSEEVPDLFRSGMTADVTFIVSKRPNALLLPSEAICEWPEKAGKIPKGDFAVYAKSFSGKLNPVPVRIGESDGRMTEILEGIKEGASILIVRKKEANAAGSPFSPFGGGKRRGT